ncbi:hypothetical protein EZS27_044105, partial [termite gut metagenome]
MPLIARHNATALRTAHMAASNAPAKNYRSDWFAHLPHMERLMILREKVWRAKVLSAKLFIQLLIFSVTVVMKE